MDPQKYLASLEKFGINLGLERINYLLEKLGNPHQKFKSIHIAGTNGKGSTAAMIASILKEAGYKVGLYTSPHLFSYRERIKINNKNISQQDFNEGIKRIKREAEASGRKREKPTVFEVLTAVAFWYFAKKKVDYAVVEVGLGGRLDATNVLQPLVSVITNIDYEHTEVLGGSLAKIAAEKAAIIKRSTPVVTAEDKKEPLEVIKYFCDRNESLLFKIDKKQRGLSTSLMGEHQHLNAACAVAAIRLANIEISRLAIKQGLKKTNWPGRLQIISRRPLVIIDGAHNPAGTRALKETVKKKFGKKFVLLFGCQKNKNFREMVKILKPVVLKAIVVRSSHQFAASPKMLKRYFIKYKIKTVTAASFEEGLAFWDHQKPLLIAGSLFLAADALKHFCF